MLKLYKDIIEEVSYNERDCVTNFREFENIFSTFNFIDAKKDYNLFCEYNKENEKRRSLSNFFVLCANYDVIDKKNIEYCYVIY